MALKHPDLLYIDGAWVQPSTDRRLRVIDSASEEVCLTVAEARDDDVLRAIDSARRAFDEGPWPHLSHAERAAFLRAFASELRKRADVIADYWPRESGALVSLAAPFTFGAAGYLDFYAGLAETFEFERPIIPASGGIGILAREPVGVVGAIIPWNGPILMAAQKLAPALLAGCTVILKCAPEAPAEGYVFAEIAEAIGLPAGVLNVIAADRESSEILVHDSRVDKITFTGSTAAGRQIASVCGNRIARCTLELGGKSPAVVLDDADIATVARTLAEAECRVTGQVCFSLTRVIVPQQRHDDMVEALADLFGSKRVGDPFDPTSQMGPLVSARQRDRVLGYIRKGVEEGATLAAGGGRPKHLARGYYVEPTVFGNVSNSSIIAREEIFGPVLCVIPARDENEAVRLANESIYGLNAGVFTRDVNRARSVARQLRAGSVGHNGARPDMTIAFGGFKQSGIGREGGVEGLLSFLETKTVMLEGPPAL